MANAEKRRIPEPRKVFTRMIAVADRECSQCEETVDEGTLYYIDKRRDVYCVACRDYEDEHHD